MGREQKIAKHFAGHCFRPSALFKDFTNRKEIAQGFRHLLLIDPDKAVMDPVARQWLTGGATRLRNFILMVRKNQIFPSSMNVECRTKVFHCHGGTFDVPSRSS